MVMGHYATALLPYEILATADNAAPGTQRRAPFWLFLLAAQLLDIAMLLFVSLGLESFLPHDYHPMETKFVDMQTDMAYTHDLIPVLLWAGGVAGIVFLVMRRTAVAVWCGVLVVVHEAFDLLVGFEHYVWGMDTAIVGFGLYSSNPVLGLLIEAAICAGLVFWFTVSRKRRGVPVSVRTQVALYAILVGGTLATLPMAF